MFRVVGFGSLLIFGMATNLFGQSNDFSPSQPRLTSSVDVMDTSQFRLRDYRRMFKTGTTPTEDELVGYWRGVNKGIVERVGYKQFIKEILPKGSTISGDNIQVHQVEQLQLRSCGWQPKVDGCNGEVVRRGKFAIEPPRGVGAFKCGIVFSYRNGDNRKGDPVRLIVDKVVKIDDNHLLGRATVKFGAVHIPVSYFVLERM